MSAVRRILRSGENQRSFARLTETLDRLCERSERRLPPWKTTVCAHIALFRCLAGYYIHVLFVAFFTSSSDVFIMLRCAVFIQAAYFAG